MFQHPEEWAHVRQLVNVFQFTQQHTFTQPDAVAGVNSYDALVRVDAFRQLSSWGKKTALGLGAVKPFYCTADSSGMDASIAASLQALQAVSQAGGSVSYALMDEPFLSGQFPQCGGPALEPTADRLLTYVSAIKSSYPNLKVGLIEAYPSFTPDQFGSMLELLRIRGILPAFLQIDVDLRAVHPPRNDFVNDIKTIRSLCATSRVPFGIILWGYNGDADALFAQDLDVLASAFRQVFPTWKDVPDQLVFESWAESSTGLRITPSNLPEGRAYTLTNILWQTYRRFVGETSAATTGTAVPRR